MNNTDFTMATTYVLGIAFDFAEGRFLLIEKNRPNWQAGKLNGIGGKVEPADISHFAAMVREFHEEANVETEEYQWQVVGTHHASKMDTGEIDYTLYIFATELDSEQVLQVKSMTDEQVQWWHFHEMGTLWDKLVPGTAWYIGMAQNSLGRHMSTMTSELI